MSLTIDVAIEADTRLALFKSQVLCDRLCDRLSSGLSRKGLAVY
ncbi:hypothetical protein [Brasilonema sp. UFV-L1]|nr:hypothetical protein [Brasilonema sp. UFV-L1]